MSMPPKLTTQAACRVAGLHRDRFNEHVAAGNFGCAPSTIPGRARLFDPDDMIALRLFRELMDDGHDAKRAGEIACTVAQAAKLHPNDRQIAYVEDYFYSGGIAMPASEVPSPDKWDGKDALICPGGTDIRKVTTFRIGKLREIIAHYTEQERSVVGEREAE